MSQKKGDNSKKKGKRLKKSIIRGKTKPSDSSKSKTKGKTPKPTQKPYKGKKRGRKQTKGNRYNSIKQGISEYYKKTVGRRVKSYELKIIYAWIKDNYSNQSLKYVLMNIDVIIDNFWQEYCNLYPINIENFARYFDWYYFKNYLYEEIRYHYPTDIIQVDLTQINEGIFEFFMEDYAEKSEELYQIGKVAGLKTLQGMYPKIYLKDAYCDVAKKGNVFQYVLLIDGEIPEETQPATTPTTVPPTTKPADDTPPSSTEKRDTSTTRTPEPEKKTKEQTQQDIRGIINDLRQDLKDGIITKEEYAALVKELIKKLNEGGEI